MAVTKSSSAGRRDEQYWFGEYTLDLNGGFLRRSGAAIDLRAQAFELLAYLIQHHGRVVSKDELVDAVWHGVAVTDNSLAQCVVEVRRALGEDGRHMVRTIPRRGYVFAATVTCLNRTHDGAGRALAAAPAQPAAMPPPGAPTDITGPLGRPSMAVSISPGSRGRVVRLPVPRTPLIGRERELADIAAAMKGSQVRLLTLTGTGGSGKTRLALQAAADLADDFPGGVYFVSLAALADPVAAESAVVQMVGMRHAGGQPLAEALREHLCASLNAPALMLFDNFEHLPGAFPLVSALLEASSYVRVLVTSREVLRLYGEHEYPVPPLTRPPAAGQFQDLAGNDAVRLFVQRAQAVNPGFQLTPANASVVANICWRLDGLPLAIELAAARSKMCSPESILARLANPLDFLVGGARDVPGRHQTLRDTIEWSHALLTADEQKLLRRLAVFAGGCTLEGVEAVCNARRDLGVQVREGMESLVDKSLVQHVGEIGSEARFGMLETIREYAVERLKGSSDEAATRRAHAAYCIVLAEEGDPQLRSVQEEWFTRCDVEHDNFRAALDWLIASSDSEWALRLGLALFHFWERREYLPEGRRRLQEVVDLPRDDVSMGFAHALCYVAVLGDAQADPEAAQRLHERALQAFRALGDKKGETTALNSLATLHRFTGNYGAARSCYEQTLAICRDIGSPFQIAAVLSNLAGVLSDEGSHDEARALLEQARTTFQQIGDQVWEMWSVSHLGDLARDRGDHVASRGYYQEAIDGFTRLGESWGIARSSADLAHAALDAGDCDAASALFTQALTMFVQLNHKRGLARVFEGLAHLAQSERDFDRALTLAGAAAAVRRACNDTPRPAEKARLERSLRAAWATRDTATAEATWIAGGRMALDEAVRYALERDGHITRS